MRAHKGRRKRTEEEEGRLWRKAEGSISHQQKEGVKRKSSSVSPLQEVHRVSLSHQNKSIQPFCLSGRTNFSLDRMKSSLCPPGRRTRHLSASL